MICRLNSKFGKHLLLTWTWRLSLWPFTYSVGFSFLTTVFFTLTFGWQFDSPLSFFLFRAAECLFSETLGTFKFVWASLGPTVGNTVLSFALFPAPFCAGSVFVDFDRLLEASFLTFIVGREPFWHFGKTGCFFSEWWIFSICGNLGKNIIYVSTEYYTSPKRACLIIVLTSCNAFQLEENCWTSVGGRVRKGFAFSFSLERVFFFLYLFVIHSFFFILAVLIFLIEFGCWGLTAYSLFVFIFDIMNTNNYSATPVTQGFVIGWISLDKFKH